MIEAKSRIKTLTTTTGTGTLSLNSTAEQGFQPFSVLMSGSEVYYTVTDVDGVNWESGIGTYSSNTLTRDTILESSTGSAISLSATGSTVFNSYPSSFASYSNVGVNRDYVSSGNIASGKPLILNTDGTVTQVASGNLTQTNYIGLANASVVSGESVPVNQVGSYNNLQSSLVTGSDYYCTDAGDVSLRTSSGTVLATQFIGTARSSTDLQLLNPPTEIVGYSNGAITKGKPVIIQADGDVTQVALASGTVTYTFSKGSATALVPSNTNNPIASCFDISADRFVLVYINEDASSYLYGNLVEVDSNNVVTSRGIDTIVSSTNGGKKPTIVYDADEEKSIVAYSSGATSDDLRCKVLTSTGSSISVGAEVIINDANDSGLYAKLAWDSSSGSVIITYKLSAGAITANAGTISGTSSSWGSAIAVSIGATPTLMGIGAGNGKVLFLTKDDSNNGDARGATVSGNTLTLGDVVEFDGTSVSDFTGTSDNVVCYDTQNDRFFLPYRADLDNSYGMVFQITGTTVSHGTRVLLLLNANDMSVAHSSDIGKIPLIYGVYSTDSLFYREATINSSDNSLTFSTAVSLSTANTNATSLSYDSTNVRLLANYDLPSDHIEAYGIVPNGSRAGLIPNLTTENYIGLANETVATNTDVKITTISGVNANQSGLTPAQLYYVQTDGTISTTASSPSVVAGVAISSTQLLVSRT